MSSDVVVIGSGPNGLTAAAALAASGRNVLVLEASATAGGGARSRAFHPGFSAPLAHWHPPVHPRVARLIGAVSGHGLPAHCEGALADSPAFAAMTRVLAGQAALLAPFLARRPPTLGQMSRGEKAFLLGRALSLRLKGRKVQEDFSRMILMPVADVVEEYLTDPGERALACFDAILGTRLGPRSPTSLLGLFYRFALGPEKEAPADGAAAYLAAAQRAGAVIRTGARVARLNLTESRVIGVTLADGEAISARAVVSAIAPGATLLGLAGARHLDAGLVRALTILPAKGNVAKLHLALSAVPDLPAGRHVLANSADAVERAFNPSKYGEVTGDPVMEFTIRTAGAPAGAAVLSAVIPYAPYAPKAGWKAEGPALQSAVMKQLERLMPGLARIVLASDFLSPPDIESSWGIPGGHWHHVDFSADHMLMLRPLHDLAGYRSTIPGLWLSGAGTHPGGGVTGLPGLLAAEALIAEGGS